MKKKNILIVEDEQDIADMLKYELERRDYETVICSDGIQALKEVHKNSPDAIIADIILPKLNGFLMIQELEKMNFDAPIIIVSGAYARQAKEIKTDLTIIRCMEKPFSIKEVLNLLHSHLHESVV